ncbi:MAG: nuclear transport factor 2 family protein [Chroococcidiopsidaceae cyanobacterium CP_BM_RX_35]|nr:nuclear transport factor 2 family protein [Chroococcidiopsidaceae cyanobacterium CP_BM_RX_35]
MRNFLTFLSVSNRFRPSSWLAVSLLTLSLISGWNRAQAETPQGFAGATSGNSRAQAQTAPSQIQNLLAQIDAAANRHDVNALLQFYSQNFTNSDGLTRLTMAKTLTQLWQRYPNLKYQTQLQSWQSEGKGYLLQTVTSITGTQSGTNRNMALNSTIKSQQRLESQKISQQAILAERSQLSTGTKPPLVEVNLPQQVKTGQRYEFDAIVQKPLSEGYLIGAATEEPVQANKYLNSSPVALELLPSGGLFKQGQAPTKPQSLWVSGVLIGNGGMTLVTQRLQVVGGNTTTNTTSP